MISLPNGQTNRKEETSRIFGPGGCWGNISLYIKYQLYIGLGYLQPQQELIPLLESGHLSCLGSRPSQVFWTCKGCKPMRLFVKTPIAYTASYAVLQNYYYIILKRNIGFGELHKWLFPLLLHRLQTHFGLSLPLICLFACLMRSLMVTNDFWLIIHAGWLRDWAWFSCTVLTSALAGIFSGGRRCQFGHKWKCY